MSKQALLNVSQLAANKGAAELEFAVKKVHSLETSKGGPDGYVKAIEKRVEKIVFEEICKFNPEDNLISKHIGHQINNSNVTWILKPIDGIENFINGYPHFSISLCSMIENEVMSAVVIDPIRRDPANPGVTVAATASISCICNFDFKKTCSIKNGRFSRCLLEAISGTTPPHLECSSICEAISLANNSILPFSLETSAAADSSQLVSRDKIIDIND